MKQLLQSMRDGKTEVVDVPVPAPKVGMVLVRTAASLVSAGTERMLVEFAEKSLVGKARSRPDLVKQVMDKARREGLLPTVEAAFNKLDQPMPLGYSSAGTIVELGEGVTGYQVGDRVVCAGGGYAVHAEYNIVPQNLLAHLPDNVNFEQGAFATLGAIAMHGFRLAQPQVGEDVVIIGLGLLGLLSVSIAQAAGCRVFGVDLDPARVALAQQMGAQAVGREGAEDAVSAFTNGRGADIVLICADTQSNDPVELAGAVARDRGRVVAVGAVGMDVPRRTYFYKELNFIVSRSYGPGRYDANYEEKGIDYPAGFVRWTAGRNLEAFVNLIGDGRMDISPIISHRFPIEDAPNAYELITGKSEESFLGIVLTYVEAESLPPRKVVISGSSLSRKGAASLKIGVLGAGNFATAVMLPAVKDISGVEFVGIASGSGVSAQHAAKKFGFKYASSDANALINDEDVNTIAVLTRHDLHTAQVLAGLKAGKHVFCEKPLALNEDQLSEIEAALVEGAPLVTVGLNRRFAPMAVKMKAFIDQRQEPLWAHYRVNAGFIPPEHWLHDPAVGGGRIIGEGIHFIDFLTYLVGAAPVSVSAQALPDGGRYQQDNVNLTFSFPDGSLGTVSYLANGDKAVAKERVEVFSGGRVAVLDDFRTLEMVANGKRKMIRNRLSQDKGHKAAWQAFASAIQAGGAPPIPYLQVLGVHRAAFGAVQALQKGERIQLDH